MMERKESASVQTHAEISGGTPIWIKSTEKLIIILFVNSVKNHFLLMETVKESIAVINAMFRTDINRRSMMDNTNKVVLADKYTLTIKEAVTYFNIGEKKMRRLAIENIGRFSIMSGNRYLIIRSKFEKFLDSTTGI